MIIQFDTAHNVKATEDFKAPLIAKLSEKLNRFSHQITRLDVHLSDENGDKEGLNDKKCLLEAHVPGMQPTVVKNHGQSYGQAMDGAIDKLKGSLHSIIGRMEDNHKH